MMHTWLSTQDEGWWRIGFDQLGVPFTYISTQDVAKDADLNSKYDVIVFAPVGRGNPQAIIDGLPMFGNPLPWKETKLTPNLGKTDQTDDIRPGLGWSGMINLQNFIRRGGLLISSMDTSDFAVSFGMTPGVSITKPTRMKITGAVVRSKMVDGTSPIAYGFSDSLSVYCFDGPIFNVSNTSGGRGGRRRPVDGSDRPTGRGSLDDPDIPQSRPGAEVPEEPKAEVWEAVPLTDEQMRNGIGIIPPAQRPRVVMRYSDARDLAVSGLVDGGAEIAQHAMVIDSPLDRGHIVLFSNNPFWRGQTAGSYFLVFNAIMNFDNLNAGRKLADR